MIDAVSPIETKLAKNELENLEMVVLLITYDIDMLVKTILGKNAAQQYRGPESYRQMYRHRGEEASCQDRQQ